MGSSIFGLVTKIWDSLGSYVTSTLHLGVVELPYADKSGTTTGDVAELLERQYKVFTLFYEAHEKDIVHALEEAYAGAVDSVMMDAPISENPAEAAMQEIESLFRKFLSTGLPTEFESLTYGDLFRPVPTKAAIKGVSHRFKNKQSGTRRPSLIDTGLFESSFKAWMDMDMPKS